MSFIILIPYTTMSFHNRLETISYPHMSHALSHSPGNSFGGHFVAVLDSHLLSKEWRVDLGGVARLANECAKETYNTVPCLALSLPLLPYRGSHLQRSPSPNNCHPRYRNALQKIIQQNWTPTCHQALPRDIELSWRIKATTCQGLKGSLTQI